MKTIAIPCEASLLPKPGDLVNIFNQITNLIAQLEMQGLADEAQKLREFDIECATRRCVFTLPQKQRNLIAMLLPEHDISSPTLAGQIAWLMDVVSGLHLELKCMHFSNELRW